MKNREFAGMLTNLQNMRETINEHKKEIEELIEPEGKTYQKKNPQPYVTMSPEWTEEDLAELKSEEYNYAFVPDYPTKGDKTAKAFARGFFLSLLNPRRYFKRAYREKD